MPDYLAAINPGQAPAGYQYAPGAIPAAPSAPSNFSQTGGGTQGTTYSPIWAANQSQQQFAQGQQGLQGVAAQLQQMIQAITQMAANPKGTNVEEQKQEAAQINAGGTNSALQQVNQNAAALGQAQGTPGLGAAQANVASQGAQNLQSAYTDINSRNAAMQQQDVATSLNALLSLMGLQTNVATNMAQLGQQQQFPILSPQAIAQGTGQGATVTGPNRQGQYGSQGTGLQLSGPDAMRYTYLTSRPFEALAGWERMELMQLRDKLGY